MPTAAAPAPRGALPTTPLLPPRCRPAILKAAGLFSHEQQAKALNLLAQLDPPEGAPQAQVWQRLLGRRTAGDARARCRLPLARHACLASPHPQPNRQLPLPCRPRQTQLNQTCGQQCTRRRRPMATGKCITTSPKCTRRPRVGGGWVDTGADRLQPGADRRGRGLPFAAPRPLALGRRLARWRLLFV